MESQSAWIDNIINSGILRPIQLLTKESHIWSALILLYAAIDAMAYMSLPETETYVRPVDFIRWVDKYMISTGWLNVTSRELYAARCGLLHTFSPYARL